MNERMMKHMRMGSILDDLSEHYSKKELLELIWLMMVDIEHEDLAWIEDNIEEHKECYEAQKNS